MRRALLAWLGAVLVGCGGAAARETRAPAAAVARPTTLAAKRALFAQAHQAVAEKRYGQALPLLETLCPVYPELADYCLYDLALSRARRGDAAAADALWAQLITTQPQSLYASRAELERGRLRRAQGDLAGARALFEAARTSDDDGVAIGALLELAELEVTAGNTAAAHDDLMAARTRAPGSPLARTAKQRIDDLRRQDPSLVPQGPALERELHLLLQEHDFAAARSAAERLLASAPAAERPDLLRQRADAEIGAGQLEDGLATLEEIVRAYPGSAAAPEAQFRYASLLWNRDRNEQAEQTFVEFRRRYPEHARLPDALYAIARIEQDGGHADEAVATYAQLADTYPGSSLAHEARWRIGWIRYEQGRWREAAAAFERAGGDADVGAAADAYYWQARALERAGDRAGGEHIYRALVAAAPGSYYALWAEQRLGRPSKQPRAIAAPATARDIGPAPAATDPYHWVRARELRAAGLQPIARAELRAFERANTQQPAATAPLLAAYQASDGYRDAIRLASARGLTDPEVFFPLAFWPLLTRHIAHTGMDPLLVLALMRQESMFDPAARSSADAQGLMQLLPGTAERVARSIGQPSPAGRLYDPDTNIGLGVAHFEQLLHAYQGDSLKALAAYNGGEDAVARWERRFGTLEPDEFVERITYRETRDYVKRVMGNYRRYQQQYQSP